MAKKKKYCVQCRQEIIGKPYHYRQVPQPVGRLHFCSSDCLVVWKPVATHSLEGKAVIKGIEIFVIAPDIKSDIHDPNVKPIILVETDVAHFDAGFNKGVTRSTHWWTFDPGKRILRVLKSDNEISDKFINKKEMELEVEKALSKV